MLTIYFFFSVYPKTDWTYSLHSRDRVELAPGVVAMPNMSRKSIHTQYSANNNVNSDYYQTEISKNTILRSLDSSSEVHHDSRFNYISNSISAESHKFYEKYTYDLTYWKQWIKIIITSVFILPLSVFYHSLESQTFWLAQLHILTSRIMLFDTWLLWKSHIGRKSAKLLALCLVPLFLLGGKLKLVFNLSVLIN